MSEDDVKKVSLTQDDWEMLLPSEEYKLGKTTLTIEPLGIKVLAKVLKKLESIITTWKDVILDKSEVQAQEFIKQAKGKGKKKKGGFVNEIKPSETQTLIEKIEQVLPRISEMILEHGIDIVSDLSGVKKNDISRLPPKEAMSLFQFCLEMNIKSQEGLEKNFASLAQMVLALTGRGVEPSEEEEKNQNQNPEEKTTTDTQSAE